MKIVNIKRKDRKDHIPFKINLKFEQQVKHIDLGYHMTFKIHLNTDFFIQISLILKSKTSL
jgi:hypothetical protein